MDGVDAWMASRGWRDWAPLRSGWSSDEKYTAVDADGAKRLVRISPAALADRRRREFDLLQTVGTLPIPASRALEHGILEDGRAYLVFDWIDGAGAEEVVPSLNEDEQYAVGLSAGVHLRTIHEIRPTPRTTWEARFGAKLDRKIEQYRACPVHVKSGTGMLAFIATHRHLLAARPQSLHHGDYHVGNMVLDDAGVLSIIDWDRLDVGDPWEEFNRIVWCARASPSFARGRVDGYFDGDVPEEFFALMALYTFANQLSSVPWALTFGEAEVATMMRQAEEVAAWYGDFERTVPTWYTT